MTVLEGSRDANDVGVGLWCGELCGQGAILHHFGKGVFQTFFDDREMSLVDHVHNQGEHINPGDLPPVFCEHDSRR